MNQSEAIGRVVLRCVNGIQSQPLLVPIQHPCHIVLCSLKALFTRQDPAEKCLGREALAPGSLGAGKGAVLPVSTLDDVLVPAHSVSAALIRRCAMGPNLVCPIEGLDGEPGRLDVDECQVVVGLKGVAKLERGIKPLCSIGEVLHFQMNLCQIHAAINAVVRGCGFKILCSLLNVLGDPQTVAEHDSQPVERLWIPLVCPTREPHPSPRRISPHPFTPQPHSAHHTGRNASQDGDIVVDTQLDVLASLALLGNQARGTAPANDGAVRRPHFLCDLEEVFPRLLVVALHTSCTLTRPQDTPAVVDSGQAKGKRR